MSDMDIDMISLVRKGANGQKIQIYKEDGEEDLDGEVTEQGLLDVLKNFFSGGKVQKSADAVPAKTAPKKTFASMMAVNDITENMWRANDTLRGVMRDIINNEEVTDKKAALLQAIEEYSTYMKNKVNSTAIAKEAAFFDVPDVEIEKAGKKVSSKNLAALKEAHRALSEVIDEAEKKEEPNQGESGDPAKEEETVNKSELTEVMKSVMESAMKPINERLDKIEKADAEPEGAGSEGGAAGEPEGNMDDDISEVVKAAVTEAFKPIESRLEAIEKSRALPRSQEGEEGTKVEKSSDVFDGLFA